MAVSAAAADALRGTPAQTPGPFYPLEKPLDVDADLTLVKGRTQQAAGQVVHVAGRVLSAGGEPVAGARIEIWQANTHGRYAHPGDRNPAPLDPNFEGYASIVSDEQGRYRFKTVKPGAYPAGGGRRPPHIHFAISSRQERLVTQMYFPGEPLNDDDFVIAALPPENRGLLVADVTRNGAELEPGAWLAHWNIVLREG
jgi:protocatechuate 3,4-dioxygenase beta subunit